MKRLPSFSRPLVLAGVILLLTPPSAVPSAAAADEAAVAPARPGVAVRYGARLREAAARHREALAELRARLAVADRAGRPAIQRAIESAKRENAAALLGLQAERARAHGRADLAAQLERRRQSVLAGGAVPAPGGER